MKTTLLTLLLFPLAFHSCKPASKEKKIQGYSNLKVIVDTAANFFLDTPSLDVNYRSYGMANSDYDTITKHTFYRYDSLANGEITITLHSLLDTIFSKKLLLTKDTTLFFSRQDIPSYEIRNTDTMSFAKLEEGEKICISYSSGGCNAHNESRLIIKRKGNEYHTDYLFYPKWDNSQEPVHIKKVFDRSLGDSLLDFQASSIRFLKKKPLMWCTGFTSYRIRKENGVYLFSDHTCSSEISFDKILRMINPPTNLN